MRLLGTRPMAERGRHVRLICTVVCCVRFGQLLCGDRTMQGRGNGDPDSFESHTSFVLQLFGLHERLIAVRWTITAIRLTLTPIRLTHSVDSYSVNINAYSVNINTYSVNYTV